MLALLRFRLLFLAGRVSDPCSLPPLSGQSNPILGLNCVIGT